MNESEQKENYLSESRTIVTERKILSKKLMKDVIKLFKL